MRFGSSIRPGGAPNNDCITADWDEILAVIIAVVMGNSDVGAPLRDEEGREATPWAFGVVEGYIGCRGVDKEKLWGRLVMAQPLSCCLGK